MALVPARCTQCGAILQVDDSNDAWVCGYCNTPFVVEKAIANYTTNVTNNYAGANINVVNESEYDHIRKLLAYYVEQGDKKRELECLNEISLKYPYYFTESDRQRAKVLYEVESFLTRIRRAGSLYDFYTFGRGGGKTQLSMLRGQLASLKVNIKETDSLEKESMENGLYDNPEIRETIASIRNLNKERLESTKKYIKQAELDIFIGKLEPVVGLGSFILIVILISKGCGLFF